mmetsp:Transcript_3461/g.6785  ORF Transcript_3461/g.6785 Transcript_3461/m.6785 type:complete len:480 (-) Transcript_3461:100-1539(-)
MGNSLGGRKWKSPNKKEKEGTTLIEILVPHIRDAHDVVGLQPEGHTPVTIVPVTSASECCCCPLCWFSVPSGFAAIVSRFGADVPGQEKDGTWSPGFHWNCCCQCLRVSRLVSRQLIIFDTPVKDCKTQDNITVNIDVLIVLEIIEASKFVYELGPEKLDALLRASQEEVLRQVAFTIPVEHIYDLHGTNTEEWVKSMNVSFKPYGVMIHHFTVRNVQIPQDMAKDFEDKTLYESKTLEKRVQQESDRLKLNNDEAREKLKEECENARMAAEEQAVTTKAQIIKEVREVLASTEKEIGVLNAQKDAEVADIVAKAELEVAKTNAEIMTTKRESQAKVNAEVGKLEAEAEAYEKQKKASARMEAAQKIAQGKKTVAEAEGAATTAFAQRRAQEQELARLDILARLAKNQSIQIATSRENNMGLAPDNSLVTQVAQQGLEALRMKLADLTSGSAAKLNFGGGDMKMELAGGLVRPVPQMKM